MKAAVFKRLGQPLVVEDRPDPTPAPADVIVKVERCGICGSDLHLTEDPIFGIPEGAVLGHEYAGEVVAVGGEVNRIKTGDRVAVFPLHGCGRCASCVEGDPIGCAQIRVGGGGYAQYSTAEEWQCVKLPRTLSFEDGALIEPLAVGLHGVQIAGMRPGARVLVIGAGPIGLAIAFWARRLGAWRVAVTANSRRREALAYEMGATHFVDPGDTSVAGVSAACDGLPDIAFECVGKPGLIARALDYVRTRGTVVVLGLCTVSDSFLPFTAISKEARIQASNCYRIRDFEIAADALDSGVVAPRSMITAAVTLEAMPPAFEALRQRTTQCKVMVKPWE